MMRGTIGGTMIRMVLGKPRNGKGLFLLYQMWQYVRMGFPVATNVELLPACPFQHRVMYFDDKETPVFQLPVCVAVDERKKERAREDGKLCQCGCERPIRWGSLQDGQPYRAFWHFMPPGVVYVWDELDNYFDSLEFLKYANVAEDARFYFKQHGKRDDIVIGAVQDINNLWNRIRRMTESFILCEHNYRTRPLLRKFPISMSSFIRTEFTDESLDPRHMVDEGYFKYSEAAEMFSWYRTKQLVGNESKYRWGGM